MHQTLKDSILKTDLQKVFESHGINAFATVFIGPSERGIKVQCVVANRYDVSLEESAIDDLADLLISTYGKYLMDNYGKYLKGIDINQSK